MKDIRRDVLSLRRGLILTCISLFIDPILHGVHCGYFIFAIGAIIVALNGQKLNEYSKEFKKIIPIAAIALMSSICFNVIFGIFNANATTEITTMLTGTKDLVQLGQEYFTVATITVFSQSLMFLLTVLFYFFVLRGLREIATLTASMSKQYLDKAYKNFLLFGLMFVALTAATSLFTLYDMNMFNGYAAGVYTIEEYEASSVKYFALSFLYTVIDIIVWIKSINTCRGHKMLAMSAVIADGTTMENYSDSIKVDARVIKEEKIEKDEYRDYDDEIR